jgi:hypothetical protein
LSLREERQRLGVKVSKAISAAEKDILVNQDSLLIFIQQSDLVAHIDESISNAVGLPLEDAHPLYAGWRVEELKRLGLDTINKVHSELETHKDDIRNFGQLWLQHVDEEPEPEPVDTLTRGISLFYLFLVKVALGSRDEGTIVLQETGLSHATHQEVKEVLEASRQSDTN